VTVTGLWFSAFGQAEREREIAGEHYSSTSLCPFLGTIGFGSLGIVQSSCRRTESPNTICQFDAPRYKRERERTFNFSIFFSFTTRIHALVHIISLPFLQTRHQDIEPADFLPHYHCSGDYFLDAGLHFCKCAPSKKRPSFYYAVKTEKELRHQ